MKRSILRRIERTRTRVIEAIRGASVSRSMAGRITWARVPGVDPDLRVRAHAASDALDGLDVLGFE